MRQPMGTPGGRFRGRDVLLDGLVGASRRLVFAAPGPHKQIRPTAAVRVSLCVPNVAIGPVLP